MHYIAVLHDVFFAFHGHFTGLAHGCFSAERNIVVVFYDFGADESFFKIGMDDSCTFRSF